MARLICAYCNSVIRRSDRTCPYCGAETETSFKNFMKERETEAEHNRELLKNLHSIRRKHLFRLVCASFAFVILSVLLFMFIKPATLKTVIFAALVLAYVVCLVRGIKDINKKNAECRELNDCIDGLSHNIIFECEDVQAYKMINDVEAMTNDGCFREGLQQIAFKVRITNGINRKIEFNLVNEFFAKNNKFGYHVRLNADGVRMEDCKLVPFFEHHEENNKIFEPPLYTDGFQKIVLRPQESIVGWVAFYVTPEATDLELLFADDSVTVAIPLSAIS